MIGIICEVAKYSGGSPGTLLSDVAAASLPSAYQWLFQVLEKMGIPIFLIWALPGLYRDLKATITIGSSNDLTLGIQAGIKQGCPLSGTLFALALVPFLRWLICQVSAIPSRAWAVADELALVARSLLRLSRQAPHISTSCIVLLASWKTKLKRWPSRSGATVSSG